MTTLHKTGLLLLAGCIGTITLVAQGRNGRYHDDRRDRDRYEYHEDYDDASRYRHGGRDAHRYPVIRQRPPAPQWHAIPRRPSPHHIWIPAEYIWQRGQYVCVPGYWTRPPRRGMQYVPGYWQPTRGGYVWIGGFWQGGSFRMGIPF